MPTLPSNTRTNGDGHPAEWYYRLDGRSRGPLTLAELEKLIGSCGDTVTSVMVRQGNDRAWVSFCSLFQTSSAPNLTIQAEADRSASTIGLTVPPVNGSLSGKFRQLLHDNWDLATAAAVWLIVNAGVVACLSGQYATERKYFKILRDLEVETKVMHENGASSQEWAQVRARVKELLRPIVHDLKISASPTQPIRQHLLWAARDHFPKCVGPQTPETEYAERAYQQHMKIVEDELEKD
jgi:hypothetical protein